MAYKVCPTCQGSGMEVVNNEAVTCRTCGGNRVVDARFFANGIGFRYCLQNITFEVCRLIRINSLRVESMPGLHT